MGTQALAFMGDAHFAALCQRVRLLCVLCTDKLNRHDNATIRQMHASNNAAARLEEVRNSTAQLRLEQRLSHGRRLDEIIIIVEHHFSCVGTRYCAVKTLARSTFWIHADTTRKQLAVAVRSIRAVSAGTVLHRCFGINIIIGFGIVDVGLCQVRG